MGEWSVEGALTSASMSLPSLGWLALLMGAKRLDGWQLFQTPQDPEVLVLGRFRFGQVQDHQAPCS